MSKLDCPPLGSKLSRSQLRRSKLVVAIVLMCLICVCSQGGPGHLYLLKNKVATFAKVEKEEDMSQ